MIIVDTHQDQKAIGSFPKSLLKDLRKQSSLKMLKKSGIKLFFYSIFSHPDTRGVNLKIEKAINIALKELKENGIILVKNKADIKKINKNDKKIFAILHIEGLYGITKETDINFLDRWFKLGVRSFGLIWKRDNFLGGGDSGTQKKGLTELGENVIRFLNEKKAIIDLAHANYKTFFDVMGKSKITAIVTHSNAFDLCRVKRNLKKDQILEIKKKNSYIGIFFGKKNISRKKIVNIDDLINQIDYFKKIIGINYLGIGSDLGGITSGVTEGLESVFCIDNLFERLKKHGYNKNEIEKIAGKNILKVLRKILPK